MTPTHLSMSHEKTDMTDRPEDVMKLARETVERLFADLRDRRFLKWLFDERGDECLIDTFKDGEELRGLDLDVQEEIKAAWAKIIAGEEVTAEYVAGPNPRFSPERPYGITIITDDEPALSACLIDKPEAGEEVGATRKDCATLAKVFEGWLNAGRQPTFSAGDMRHIIATLKAAASASPLSAGDAGEIERLAPVDVYKVLKRASDNGTLDADHLSSLSREIAALGAAKGNMA